MGVHFEAEGLPYEETYDCGYITYGMYRMALASAISPVAGMVLRRLLLGGMVVDDDGVTSFELDGDDIAKSRLDAEDVIKAIAQGMPSATVAGFKGDWLLGERPISVRAPFDEVDAFLRSELGDTCCECLFYAPDTEGELTGEECAELVADIEEHLDGKEPPHMPGHNYGEAGYATDEEGRLVPVMREYDMHEQFMGMFRHCAERGVRLTWC